MTPQLQTRYVFMITARIGDVTTAGDIGTGVSQAEISHVAEISQAKAALPDHHRAARSSRTGRDIEPRGRRMSAVMPLLLDPLCRPHA
jgi:hypothetical protein